MNPKLKRKISKEEEENDYIGGPVIMKGLPGADFMFDAQ